AFWASLLFLIHPLHNAAVAYVSGRADLLVACFMLLGMICFSKSLVESPNKIYCYVLSLVLFFVSLFTKEISLLLPILLILLYQTTNINPKSKGLLNFFINIVPFLIIGFVFLRYSFLFTEEAFVPHNLSIVSWPKLLTWIKVIFIYLGLVFLPLNLHMERATAIVGSLKDSLAPLLIIGVLVLVFIMRVIYKQSKVSFFGISWFFIAAVSIFFSMYFNTTMLNKNLAIMAEHWLYLPLIGFTIFIAGGLEIILERSSVVFKRAISAMLVLAAIFYSFQTVKINHIWKDDESLFKNILRYAPYSEKPYLVLGQLYISKGDFDQAIALFRKGLAANPTGAVLYTNLGIALERKKDLVSAIEAYKQAIGLNPSSYEAYNNLGVIYAKSGQIEKAKEQFKMSLDANSDFDLAYNNLVWAYKKDKTIKRYKTQIGKDPLNLKLNQELAGYYISVGLYPEAIEILKKCLSFAPQDSQNYNLLGLINVRFRYLKEAEKYFKKAIEVSPNLVVPYNNLATLYVIQKKLKQAKTVWERALRVDPHSDLVKDNLKKLEKKWILEDE
ncbi:MAG: tetratricopeptide repeat protein, partial [Candidatus Omnitrophota bacterium]|nr:tetratricopeptide repeat protein [Candidatus Omnitrophota bacterium]